MTSSKGSSAITATNMNLTADTMDYRTCLLSHARACNSPLSSGLAGAQQNAIQLRPAQPRAGRTVTFSHASRTSARSPAAYMQYTSRHSAHPLGHGSVAGLVRLLSCPAFTFRVRLPFCPARHQQALWVPRLGSGGPSESGYSSSLPMLMLRAFRSGSSPARQALCCP